jgi:hypothetical protein
MTLKQNSRDMYRGINKLKKDRLLAWNARCKGYQVWLRYKFLMYCKQEEESLLSVIG